MTRSTITVGVQPNTKLLRVERMTPRTVPMDWGDELIVGTGSWMVWLNANHDFTLGTYLLLHDDGSIERVTAEPDGGEDIFTVKQRDET